MFFYNGSLSGKSFLLPILLSLSLLPAIGSATTYSSSDEPVTNWTVRDNSPAGAAATALYSNEALGHVARLQGSGTRNAFMLGSTSATNSWNNRSEFFASWRMQASQAYHLYIRVQTSDGLRWLLYNYAESSTLADANGTVIHHGLGDASRNGSWQSFTRDLQADVQAAQPGNTLLAVYGMLFRGSASITDVRLTDSQVYAASIAGPEVVSVSQPFTLSAENTGNPAGVVYEWRNSAGSVLGNTSTLTRHEPTPGEYVYALHLTTGANPPSIDTITVSVGDASTATVYENAEDNSSARWRVYDRNPEGASIRVVDSAAVASRVIQLQGSGTENGYITGGFDAATGWNNRLQTVLGWQQRFAEYFIVYARVDTLQGVRYLYYTHSNNDRLANSSGKYIHHGLGSQSRDGNWHSFNRDLRADLQDAQPDNDIVAVNGFLVRGSGEIDNITLSVAPNDTEDPPPVAAVPDNLSPLPGSIIEAGSTQRFKWTPVAGATAYDFHFFNQVTGDLTFFRDLSVTEHCDGVACSLETTVNLPASSAHAWRVRAVNSTGRSEWSRSTFAVIPPLTAAPASPQLLSPAATTDVFPDSNTVFTWGTSDTAANYELRLVDLTDSVVVSSGELGATDVCTNQRCSSNLLLSSLIAADNFRWQVRAGNRLGWSDWSSRSINVLPVPTSAPGIPVNLSPAVGAMLSRGDTVSFSWQAEPQAAKYDFYIYDVSNTDLVQRRDLRPATVCDAGTCQLTLLIDFAPADKYRWRVSARNTLGISNFSSSEFQVVETATNEPPNLTLSSSLSDLSNPYAITLDASGSTDDTGITSYHWDFGDGSDTQQGSTAIVTHDYSNSGQYTVTLSATDTQGATSSTTLIVAVNTDVPPVAQISTVSATDPVTGTAPLTLSLDPSGSSDDQGLVEFQWEFGDGTATQTTTTAETVEHTYESPGIFTLVLQVTDTSGQTHSASLSVQVFAAGDKPSESEAARFLTQATFGVTAESLAELTSLGYSNWLDTQFGLQGPPHLDHVLQYSNGSNREARHEVWWNDVVNGPDQLRQRIAYALSQLFVVSDTGYTLSNGQYGVTHYYDLLRDNAFGNYRELLEDITLNPVMGIYLSMLQNDKGYTSTGTRPDENFAREVLQLFSVGLHMLELDGSASSPKTPAFSQAVVENFARVFTGWNYKDAGVWNRQLFTGQDMISPLEPFESHHDTGAKTLLSYGEVSGSIPAGLSAKEDMRRALDNIANHPNVGPFVSRHLIQQLVTSNPTPGYVRRVATVFNNNGSGTRGDLKAVVRAVLMDDEARSGQSQPGYGKLREPVLKLSHLWRAFNITPGAWSNHGEFSTYSPPLSNLEIDTGQAVLRSPSVFNFYSPDHAPAGPIAMHNLVAPESEIYTDSNILSTTARINSQIQRHYLGTGQPSDLNPAYLDYSDEVDLAADPAALLDHLDLLLLSGSMSGELHSIVFDHIDAIDGNDTEGLHARVRDAIALIMLAPEYQVQR